LGADPRFVQTEPVGAVFASCIGGSPASRGLPGGNSLFFCVAKRKVSKRKGDPMVRVPSLRCGQPAVLAESGVELELATLRQSLALIRFRLCSSARPDGLGSEYGCGEARTRFARPRRSPTAYPIPIPNPLLTPPPFWLRRGAQGQTDQDGRLSEPKASSSPAPAGPSTAGCPRSLSEGGRRQQGRLFFAYFLLAKQKKVSSRRATPGLLANHYGSEAPRSAMEITKC
jgi:hypothetical protein